MGQFWNLLRAPSAEPMRAWLDEVPNDGLIRYLDFFNSERLLVTNPAVLGEMLVQKTYDFIKPPAMTFGLGRILGVGLFLAEGDEHRVSLCVHEMTRLLSLPFTTNRDKERIFCLPLHLDTLRNCTRSFGARPKS